MASDANVRGGIIVKKLVKLFQRQKVLDEVSIEVPGCSRMLLLGPSGAGKSTLLRIIAGLDLPDAGEVFLGGELASTSAWCLEPNRRNLGFVFQTPTLWPHMTVEENVLFGLANQPRREAKQHAAALLEKARISHVAAKYPDQISGGEAKRAALVRSIAPCPRILLVDEPFANLDAATKMALLAFLLAMTDEFQMTLIYVTHDDDEASRVGGQIVRLHPPYLATSSGI